MWDIYNFTVKDLVSLSAAQIDLQNNFGANVTEILGGNMKVGGGTKFTLLVSRENKRIKTIKQSNKSVEVYV